MTLEEYLWQCSHDYRGDANTERIRGTQDGYIAMTGMWSIIKRHHKGTKKEQLIVFIFYLHGSFKAYKEKGDEHSLGKADAYCDVYKQLKGNIPV